MEDQTAKEIIEELRIIRLEITNIVKAIVRVDQSIMSFKGRGPLHQDSSEKPSHD